MDKNTVLKDRKVRKVLIGQNGVSRTIIDRITVIEY